MKELGDITDHTNTVNAVAFVGKTHFLSGCQEGKIFLRRANDWQKVHEFKGQRDGACTNIAVHKSNNLFFTTSRDNSLRLWDLKTRKAASRNRLEEVKEINFVEWNCSGTQYCVVCDDKDFMIFNVSDAEALPDVKFRSSSRINSVCFFEKEESLVALGLESGSLIIYNSLKKDIEQEFECDTHVKTKARIRFVKCLKGFIFVALSTNQLLILQRNETTNLFEVVHEIGVGSKGHISAFDVCMI